VVANELQRGDEGDRVIGIVGDAHGLLDRFDLDASESGRFDDASDLVLVGKANGPGAPGGPKSGKPTCFAAAAPETAIHSLWETSCQQTMASRRGAGGCGCG
jgi:hypothetical protein